MSFPLYVPSRHASLLTSGYRPQVSLLSKTDWLCCSEHRTSNTNRGLSYPRYMQYWRLLILESVILCIFMQWLKHLKFKESFGPVILSQTTVSGTRQCYWHTSVLLAQDSATGTRQCYDFMFTCLEHRNILMHNILILWSPVLLAHSIKVTLSLLVFISTFLGAF
jgi:hypothetical protein